VDLDALEVEAEVSEDQLRRIEEGQPALVFLDAYADEVFRGVAGTVRPAVDRAKATAVVKVRFEEAPLGALPDMSAKIAFLEEEVPSQELEGAPRLRVPAEAVMERDGAALLVTIEDGRAKLVPVAIVERAGDDVVLDAGPPAGTKVAVGFPEGVRDGQRLRIETETS
jgi:multidrug efflux pump subunit AcrA (membrane-fusion protein)